MSKKDSNFIALGGDAGFLECFAKGSGGEIVPRKQFVFEDDITKPIAFRGIKKGGLVRKCWDHGRDFYYMDTGYFANYPNQFNPKGAKRWHRIVKNNVQHLGPIINRPDDRWTHLQNEFPKLQWRGWKKSGKNILLVVPSEKPCIFYGISHAEWTENVIKTLQKYTDRPVVTRYKSSTRTERALINTIYDAMDDDIFAVVTYNSIAATEAVAYGIPAFALAPNAASPVCSDDLSKIETPYYPDEELIRRWCCHLSYGQFSVDELLDGTAWSILNAD